MVHLINHHGMITILCSTKYRHSKLTSTHSHLPTHFKWLTVQEMYHFSPQPPFLIFLCENIKLHHIIEKYYFSGEESECGLVTELWIYTEILPIKMWKSLLDSTNSNLQACYHIVWCRKCYLMLLRKVAKQCWTAVRVRLLVTTWHVQQFNIFNNLDQH